MEDRHRKILEMFAAGRTYAEIAESFSVHATTVWRWWKKARAWAEKNGVEIQTQPRPSKSGRKRSEISTETTRDGQKIVTAEGQITTLDKLLEAANVDRSQWVVTKWIANKWEAMLKDSNGEPRIQPLWQVKAWLSAIPEFIRQPVQTVHHIPRKPPKGLSRGVRRCVVIPDSQNGYRVKRSVFGNTWEPLHDRRALDLAVQLCHRVQPEEIILLGDMLDLAPMGKYSTTNDLLLTTNTTLIELHWWLGQIRQAAPSARIRYLEGNHEVRLRRQLTDHMKEAADLKPVQDPTGPNALSVARLLNLQSLDIEYVTGYPGAEIWLWDRVRVYHGDTARGGSGATMGALIKGANAHIVCGHIHRVEMIGRTVSNARGQQTYYAASPGCLTRIDGVVPGSTQRTNWQQGLGVVYLHPETKTDGESVTMQMMPIQKGRMIHNDQQLIGEDRIKEIRKATGMVYI